MMRLPALVLVAALLAGCASSRPHDEQTLRLFDLDPPTLNPLVNDNATIVDFAQFIHGFLLRTDDRGRFLPDLAVRVPTVANGGIADGGRTIRYRLARGVRWHDGAAFDARDVAFSFRAASTTSPRSRRRAATTSSSGSNGRTRPRSRRSSRRVRTTSTRSSRRICSRICPISTRRRTTAIPWASVRIGSSRGNAGRASSSKRTRISGAARRTSSASRSRS
jgi:hypothetical protein